MHYEHKKRNRMIINNYVTILLVGCLYPYIFCMEKSIVEVNSTSTMQKTLYGNVPSEIWSKIHNYSIVSEKILSVEETQRHNAPFQYQSNPFEHAPHIKYSINVNENKPTPLTDQWFHWQEAHDYGSINFRNGSDNEETDNMLNGKSNENVFCFGPFYMGTKKAYIVNNLIATANDKEKNIGFDNPSPPWTFFMPTGIPISCNYVSKFFCGEFVGCDNKNKCLYAMRLDTGFLVCHRYKPEKDVFEQTIVQDELAPNTLSQLLPTEKLEKKHSNYKMQIDPRNPTTLLVSYNNEHNNTAYKVYSRKSNAIIHSGECLPHETVLLDQGLPEGLRILGDHTSLRVVTISEEFDFTSVYLVGLMHRAQHLSRHIRSNKVTSPHMFVSASSILNNFKKRVPIGTDRYFWVYQSKEYDGSYGMTILHNYVQNTRKGILGMAIASEASRMRKQAQSCAIDILD
jgi:hypothetical protein